ncbi:AfsR/SARP family transcriptional regulator [Actinoplanes awajinensis]|uniref:Bacterial transcriptional activator domain-containing protein n=1 Tax=Actinoplanes awajinensis subsp. mycoplanecinus TaxID=135947 RepID=A0A0X3UPJ4_9ACTN|nr:BTAD domain-containing putative transcriptional regulator [Actinoplanes awajinensis]KUL34498.1 hypothetical protein ADL15_15560 [Actinoplanes awajinensis subsp. mycoplanecinus]
MSSSEAGAGWRFQLLGPVTASYADAEIDVGGPVARAMLAALLLADRTRTTESLVVRVWGEPGATTRDSVYHYIGQLRGRLHRIGPGARITGQRPGYRLTVAEEAVDWRRFRRLEEEAGQAYAAGDPDRAAAALRAGLRLWTGPPLDEIDGRLGRERAELLDHRLTALERLAALEAASGRFEEVVSLLQPEIGAAPQRERMAVLLIDALHRLGRRDSAVSVYQQTAFHLRTGLGLDPGPRLEQAHRALLAPGSSRPAPVAVRPPRPDRHFLGRDAELRIVLRALANGDVCVIQGMPGVGKSALALRAAESHPGYVLLNMSQYEDADAALGALLHRLGARIPAGPEARADLLRDTLRERPTLIVLDDIRDVGQIRPLLTGGATLVTTRSQLPSLDDAAVLTLEPLPPGPAAELFRSIVGEDRLAGEPDARNDIDEIVTYCGGLPLALRIVAARHRLAGAQGLTDLRATLASFEGLDDGERSVQASFRTAVVGLDARDRTTLGLLAAAPGPDIERLAAAALLDCEPIEAAVRIGRLVDRHLVAEHRRHRYRMHDLLRAFVRAGDGIAPDREHLTRLTGYYLRGAEAADRIITPHRFRPPSPPAGTGELPQLTGYPDALAWLTDEQHNLAATCVAASESGLDAHAWLLAYALRGFYYVAKPWPEWLATHNAALRSARRLGDPWAELATRNNLGLAYVELGRLDDAADQYRQAIALAERAGDQHATQNARANLAWLHFSRHEYVRFLTEIQPAYEFYVASGSSRNSAITLRGIGLAEGELRRIDEAVAHLSSALDIFHRLGLPLDAAMTYNALGDAYRHVGQDLSAAAAYRQGLAAAEKCGSVFERARAHQRLGEIAHRHGEVMAAAAHWRAAASGYHELGVTKTAEGYGLLVEAAFR